MKLKKSKIKLASVAECTLNELEKVALSPETVASAAKKRGVTVEYLNRLVQRAGDRRRHADAHLWRKRMGGLEGVAIDDDVVSYSRGFFNQNARNYILSKRNQFIDKYMKRMHKQASTASHAIELLGLGTLAAPSVHELRGKKVNEKTKAMAETAGLGILAAPSMYELSKKGLNLVKKAGFIRGKTSGGPTNIIGGMGMGMAPKMPTPTPGAMPMPKMAAIRPGSQQALQQQMRTTGLRPDQVQRNGMAVPAQAAAAPAPRPAGMVSANMGTGRADMLASFTPPGQFSGGAPTRKPALASKAVSSAGPKMAPLGKVTNQAAAKASKNIGVLSKALSLFKG